MGQWVKHGGGGVVCQEDLEVLSVSLVFHKYMDFFFYIKNSKSRIRILTQLVCFVSMNSDFT